MSENSEEVRALERESARAVRHFAVFWLGLPTLFFAFSATVAGVLSRLQDGRAAGGFGVAMVGGLACFLVGRLLWRVIKK